jgi:diacylglycerol kinase family enzyme
LGDVLRLSAEMLAGRWQEDDALGIESVGWVRIRMKRPSVKVMIDGEVEMFSSPLDFRIRPKALTVLAPVAAVVTDPADGELIAVTG